MLYHELAKYYDLIYLWKDYKKDIIKIKKLISHHKKSDGNELLDAACGTGRHLKYLKSNFSCTGIDSNQSMLDIAKKNVKGVLFKKADMAKFNLNRKVDIILCLFSSIGYVKTCTNLRRAIKNFSRHLKKGGIAIIEPWFVKSKFKAGMPGMSTYDGKYIKIARLNNSKVKNNISVLDMHYLIGEKDKKVKYFSDRHELGLFEMNKTLEIMREAGFQAKFLKNGLMENRGIYLGVKI